VIKPIRIQRRRTAGYSMQAESRAANGLDCISVARPGRFGNPYDVRIYGRPLAMALFRNTANAVWNPSVMQGQSGELSDAACTAHIAFMRRLGGHPLEIARSELRGHNLSCYCSLSEACHADIWLEVAND
jgi:Domain of unknown function (DUF4326)